MAVLIKDNRKYLVSDKQLERITNPRFLDRLGSAWKSFTITMGGTGVPFDQGDTWLRGPYLRSPISLNPDAEADRLDQNAIIMACLFANMEAVCEAPPRVMEKIAGGKPEEIVGHPLTALLEDPNEYTDGSLMWMALAFAFKCDGRGYWLKERNGSGMVIGLWYEPNSTIRPAWNTDRPMPTDAFISHYELWRDKRWQRIEKEDVLHFRYGLNPRNPRQGVPTLMSALREVMTDNEAASYSATLLHNTGIAGAVISPKGEMEFDDPEGVKQDYIEKTTGDRRGEPLVMQVPTEVTIPAFSPEQMVITALRRLPEERITSLLRTPAVVAGLGAGLDRMIYNNYGEAREHFMEGSIIPMQSLWAKLLTVQLLRKEFGGRPNHFVDFDYTNVRVLQDDENKKAQRWATMYNAGFAKRSEARAAFSLEVAPEDEEYKSGGSGAQAPQEPEPPVGADGLPPALEPLVPPEPAKVLANGSGSGNGHKGEAWPPQ